MLAHSLIDLEGVAQNIHQCYLSNDIQNKQNRNVHLLVLWICVQDKIKVLDPVLKQKVVVLDTCLCCHRHHKKVFHLNWWYFFTWSFVLADCNKSDEMKLNPVNNVRKHLGVAKTFILLKAHSTQLMSKSKSTCSK